MTNLLSQFWSTMVILFQKKLTRERYFQKEGKKCINDGKHQPRHNVVLFRYVKCHKMLFRFFIAGEYTILGGHLVPLGSPGEVQ